MATKRSFAHGLDFTSAQKLTHTALLDYQQRLVKYNLSVQWKDANTADVGFTVLDTRMNGQITVTPKDVEIRVDVPMKFKLFEGMAANVVAQEVRGCVDKAKLAGVV